MKIDVLLIYEHRTREIENVALLSTELQRRGYSVRVENIYSPWLYYIEAKVVIVPHLYNDDQLNFFCNNYKHSNHNIISLQYEQVLSDSDEDGIQNPKGEAQKAHHIAWGKAQKDRYLKHGIDPSHVHTTGCISMDLFRPEFMDYFMSKECISKEFHLDPNKQWVLFISSFSYTHRTEEELSSYEKMSPTAREFAKISDESCDMIAEWFEMAAKANPDKEFIYRPHPAEINTDLFNDIERRLANVHVIPNYSVRQWAHSCDKIYNWFSTSVVDIYYAGKACQILRPIEIPNNLEVTILKGADFITSYDNFAASLSSDTNKFPVQVEQIEYFYGKGDSRMAYLQTVDICESMMKGIIPSESFKYERRNYSLRHIISRFVSGLLFIFCKNFKLPKHAIKLLGPKAKLVNIFLTDVNGIQREYKQYQKRFKKTLK